jgi:GTP cyclohydrolase II
VGNHKCLWRVSKPAAVSLFGVSFVVRVVSCTRARCRHATVAAIHGDVASDDHVLLRLHSACLFGDTFRSTACDCSWQLRRSVTLMRERGRGILLYFTSHDGRGHGVRTKVESLSVMAELNVDTVRAYDLLGVKQDIRDYSAGNWFLESIGVRRVDILTNNTRKVAALMATCTTVRTIPLVSPRMSRHVKQQIRAKVAHLDHIVEE